MWIPGSSLDHYGTTDTIQGEEEELEQTKRLRQKTEERFQEQIAERRRRLELELRRTGRRRSRSRYRTDNKNLLGVNPHYSHRFFFTITSSYLLYFIFIMKMTDTNLTFVLSWFSKLSLIIQPKYKFFLLTCQTYYLTIFCPTIS